MAEVSNVRRGKTQTQTLHGPDGPVQQIIRQANTPEVVIDSLGRKLSVKPVGALEKFRLFKVVGADASQNPMYFAYCCLAIAVNAIDGDAIDPCMTVREIEGLIQRLGDEGLEAVNTFVETSKLSQAGLVESARNFPETPGSTK